MNKQAIKKLQDNKPDGAIHYDTFWKQYLKRLAMLFMFI